MVSSSSQPTKQIRYVATVPPQEIVPVVDSSFESNIKGLFVIGDVTGLPLVKVAANQGVDVVQSMERKGLLTNQASNEIGLDVVIVGGGPAGLSAAMELSKLGRTYVVLEQAKSANTVRSFPSGKHVYSEPRSLENYSAIAIDDDPERDEFIKRVESFIESKGIHLKEEVEVVQVQKKREQHFDVITKDGITFTARSVIVAIGRQGKPRKLNIPGETLIHKVTHRLHTANDYQEQEILIVGGGNSAVEAALMLCESNRVTLSYRGDDFFRLKVNNREALTQAIEEHRITVHLQSNLTKIGEHEVEIEKNGTLKTLKNDRVIILIGSMPPIQFLLNMGLEMDGVWTKKRVVWSIIGILVGYLIYFQAKHFELLPESAGDGQILIPGFSWLYALIPNYFSNLYGLYYLLYFSLIAVFGIYWAWRNKHKLVWRRNLSNIFIQWTLWWGIPTFLVVALGRNPWTPLIAKSLNAWPLNIMAFNIDPVVGAGDPVWWHTFAIVGVIWAAVLTFIILPIFTLLIGKHYCSHVCSCGALAETVGHSFRHRGPKGDLPRWIERFGFVFIPLASIATIAHLMGYETLLQQYNVYIGTLLAGALAIGLYPFLGQRIWCRYWCPLAFWMNFWGRWSRFKITSDPGKCIDCNVCNQYCQMGIDIKSRALRGEPVTLKDTPCVACAECVVRCPMQILHLGELPKH